MSDELKDFRYYADKAEAWLETTWKESPGNDIGHSSAKATVYAELAKAAPKVAPEPGYIVLTRDEAAMKAANDTKFATRLKAKLWEKDID
jgi:hypothetical protein